MHANQLPFENSIVTKKRKKTNFTKWCFLLVLLYIEKDRNEMETKNGNFFS